MPWMSQEVYNEGQEIRVEVTLTTNHGGHMELYVCGLGDASTQECLDSNPVKFVRDELYGGPVDPNYPERAYFAYGQSDFAFTYKLPMGVTGDKVLMQWRYVTANSCVPPGYRDSGIQSILSDLGWLLSMNMNDCAYPYDATGARCDTCPEQFWNCAEVTILEGSPQMPQTLSPTVPVPVPVSAPVSQPAPTTPSTPTSLQTATTTRYWDCSGGACGCAYLPNDDPASPAHCYGNAMFDAPTNNPYGAKFYGTAAVSEALFQGGGSYWLGEGCGKCWKVTGTSNTPGYEGVETTLVLKGTNVCPPENVQCSNGKVHFDIAAPGFDVLAFSLANSCAEREPGELVGFQSCSGWMIDSQQPDQNCDCDQFNDPVLRDGCHNFFSLKWDNPAVSYEEVQCPFELDRLNCWEENGNDYPFGIPEFCATNINEDGTSSPIATVTSSPTSSPISGIPCGNGVVGNGRCADSSLCCSQWGYCGSTSAYCGSSPTTAPVPTTLPPPSPTVVYPPSTVQHDKSRLIAYLGNWQSCPTTEEVYNYTHIVIAFAVSYTWAPSKNICSETCEISEPLICNNSPNPSLVSEWKLAGKKIILSFGGAGMGGSWAGDVNDCWEYCYGRETQVVDRLVQIVNNMGLDGIDIDFEYHVTPQAVTFLNQVTAGLRDKLPTESEITHAPMDSDIVPGKPYYDSVLLSTGHLLDFLMPQYYNGITRPVMDSIYSSGYGASSALSHYRTIVDGIYEGDPKRIVFGFCISDCRGTGATANGSQASAVMTDLATEYPCNGGAFFWVAEHDVGGAWSSEVSSTIQTLDMIGCMSSPVASTPNPTSSPNESTGVPTKSPVVSPTVSPTKSPTVIPTKSPAVPVTKTPTAAPTKSPVVNDTKSPTLSPVKRPTVGSSFCCSWDGKYCGADEWCSTFEDYCSSCGGYWIEDGPKSCVAKWGDCTNNTNECCVGTCKGNRWYKQCK
jgi:hypothetical protein